MLIVFANRYRTLAPLDSVDGEALRLGARVIGVCREKQNTLTAARARERLDVLMLADVTGEVSAMYGLFDWQTAETEPGFFVIDRLGVVRLVVLGHLFPPHEMLDLVRFVTGGW